MSNSKDELMKNLIPSLKDKFFQPDLADAQPSEAELKSKRTKRNILYAVCLIVSLAVFAILAFNSYKYSAKPQSIEDVPLIRKDLTPIRIQPEDPGGEKFQNQDKLIYNDLIKSSSTNVQPSKTVEVEMVNYNPTPVVVEVEKKVPQKEVVTPKKVKVYEKPKVAKKKKVNNPFDILDDEISASDNTKVSN